MPILKESRRYFDVVVDNSTDNSLVIYDKEAIKESITNIFRVPYGDAGGIFRPNWGSLLKFWLHEPMTANVTEAIQMIIAEDLRRNNRFMQIDIGSIVVKPLEDDPPGYNIKIGLNSNVGTLDFNLTA